MKILANDGLSQAGIDHLKEGGFEVLTEKIPQGELIDFINENKIEVLLVRSATQVRKDLIDATDLKIIGRGGVGLDNIDVEYAKSKGIPVINTPGASSASVGEMVMAHVYTLFRNLHLANREMPLSGESQFKDLKKQFSKARELRGKTMGVIGFGRIGRETAKDALGAGMKVIFFDPFIENSDVTFDFFDGQKITFNFERVTLDELLKQSDVISIHVPAQKDYIIGAAEIKKMKKGAMLVNTARGGVVDEKALLSALESGHLSGAALDVFEEEPTPGIKLLMEDKLSLSPHLAGSTSEAQDRIGTELAEQIIDIYKR